MMKIHKEKRIAGALLIACLITQGGYSQEKREHTEPPGPIAFIFNGYKRAATSIGPRNILIEGNTIEGCPSPEIALHWVRNAVVRANSFKQRDGNTPARIEVRNSENIVQKSR